MADSESTSTPTDFESHLNNLRSDDLRVRWDSVVALARHPAHPRWYEAWEAIEQRIDHERSLGTGLSSHMAVAISMISARNMPPEMKAHSILGDVIPDFLVTYDEEFRGIRRDPTYEDWKRVDDARHDG